MKSIEIELIQDTRFTDTKEGAKKNVETWVNDITEKLKFLIGVETTTEQIREIDFSGIEPCTSYRQKVVIRRYKAKYQATLNDIFKTVNSVKPCYFKKI